MFFISKAVQTKRINRETE